MKTLLGIFFLSLIHYFAAAQNDILNGMDVSHQFMLYNELELYSKPNAFKNIHYNSLNIKIDSLLDSGENNYFISPGNTGYFFFKDKGKLNVMKIIIRQNDYFILCPREINNLCNCHGDSYIYIPKSNSFHSIFKLFSFSYKNDLINSINKYTGNNLNKKEYEDYCHLISELKGY